MLHHPFVVLDLETSGIDPKKEDIIEVALIRYEQGKEVARYQALIQRGQALPDLITHITGITNEMLQKEGQEKAEVLKRTQELIRGAYLIGHNIQFDAGFLAAHGIEMDILGQLDTIPLAQIAFPDLPSYSLESITDDLSISHADSHRAMADVQASLALMQRALAELSRLPAPDLKQMRELMQRSEWPSAVFFEGVQPSVVAPSLPAGRQAEPRGLSVVQFSAEDGDEEGANRPLDSTRGDNQNNLNPSQITNGVQRALSIQELFGSEGVMARAMEHYEPRPQQMKMAQGISEAFAGGYHLICEAPTGVGKSLAYLGAAAEMSIRNKSKVVLSTNTVNLQQQLYEKDVPLLQSLYRHETGHSGVKVALLKGRSHYLCLRRLAEFAQRPRFSNDEMLLLSKILVWRALQGGRELSDMSLTREESLIWDFELCADQKYCQPQKCKSYGECDLQKARKIAESADILIVNHALLCADLNASGGLLPDYRYLVVDEAHHFEEVATQAFGTQIRQENLAIPAKTLATQLQLLQQRLGGSLFLSSSLFQSVEALILASSPLQDSIQRFFDLTAFFVAQNVPQSGFVEHLLIDRTVLGMQEWLNLGDSFGELKGQIEAWLKSLREFAAGLERMESSAFPGREAFLDELRQEISLLAEQLLTLKRFFAQELPDPAPLPLETDAPEEASKKSATAWIRWITSDMMGALTLHVAPLLPGDLLKDDLYGSKKSIVFTSATLGVRLTQPGMEESEGPSPFEYFRRMLGLGDDFEELVLDSPFNFETQTYVIVPSDLLPVQAHASVQQAGSFILSLLRAVRGGLLGLFTSHGALQHVYLQIAPQASAEGIQVIGQRISGGRGKVLKAYLNNPQRSALLGVNSFWEGVDLQGEALTTLVMHKLPFDVPSDPIVAVRSQMFQNGFMQYLVPRAILRFRQGFGRLIRSAKDYGVMVILDNRVLSKDYGKMFLQSLPKGLTLETMPMAEVPGKVKEWLEGWRGMGV